MQKIFTACFFLFFWAAATVVLAQVPKDATVPLTATVNTSPVSVTLNWPTPITSTVRVLRRLKGQTGAWTSLLNAANSTQTSLTDANVTLGQTYEYRVERLSNVAAYGYAHVAVEAPVTDSRGKVLLFTDAALVAPLAAEIARLKDDLRGEGWQVIEYVTEASSTVQEVKAKIVSAYNADPVGVKSVFLLGSIPVPYSGNTQWDGHPEHNGAWPADTYYADLNGTWTDATVNNTTPARTANHNIPGDGKFDQNFLPSSAEVAVGRVDFRRIAAAAFGAANTADLYRRYLDKNHNWRAGLYQTEKKALVDDSFGYFNGEAFAANGFRNAYPLVGEANIEQTDFFTNTNPQRWLLGYGTGGGTYTSAAGVGSSSNFATDTVHIVFSNLFGSYHGDWDFESNPFMPSALASRGGILTCGWAGRPHHYYQALASGESIGFCMLQTLNAVYNPGYHPTQAEGGTHMALLGDPTLRAQIVPPARGLTLVQSGCSSVTFGWTSAADPSVSGYHIYRAASPDGPYERLTFDPLPDTTYTDSSPLTGTAYYSVRSVKKETSPGGGVYWNTGAGTPFEVNFTPGVPPLVSTTGAEINCITPAPVIVATSNIPDSKFLWTGPNNFSSQQPSATVTEAGTYIVMVTAPDGCAATATATVTKNTDTPSLSLPSELRYTCSTICAALNLPSLPNIRYEINNQPVTNLTQEFCNAGQYSIKAINTQSGCSKDYPLEVIADVNDPGASAGFSGSGILSCQQQSVQLTGNSTTPGVTYFWNGPDGFTSALQNPTVSKLGQYILTVTNPSNGCTSTDEVGIQGDVVVPTISVPTNVVITCVVATVQICAQVEPSNSSVIWQGPGGFTSTQKCINGSLPGIYTVIATHPVSGCTATAQVSINSDATPPALAITGDNSVLTCLNPAATLCAQVGPDVAVSWVGPFFSSSQICVTVNVPGTYLCVATNIVNGCTSTASAAVLQDVIPPDISIPTIEQLDCNTPCVTVKPNSSTSGAVLSEQEICQPGTYLAQVTNPANGCTAQASFEVNQAPPLFVDVPPIPMFCPGSSITLELKVSGGTPPYRYLWTTGATTASVTLPPNFSGEIAVTVSDDGGCEVVIPPLFIPPFPPIGIVGSTVNESALGANDGAASVTVGGGNGGYTYLWSNGKTTASITGLTGGIYTITVTDVAGCTAVATFEVKTTVGTHETDWLSELTLAPNPTEGISQLTLRLHEPKALTITIQDAAGRLIFEEKMGAAEVFNPKFDLSQQPAGVYFLRLQAGRQTALRRLVIVR